MVLVLLILLNLLVPQTIESEAFIEVTRFVVPPVARAGEQAWLVCAYKLSDGDTLHAMKLFKDNKEFYRYTPVGRKEDRKMAFGVPGAMVNIARSNDRQVLLQNVQKASAGVYRCQVSVEGTFRSISVEKAMTVVDADNSSNSLVNNKQANHRNTAFTQGQQPSRGAQRGESNFITSILEPITQRQHQSSSASSLSSGIIISCCAIQLVILYSILRSWAQRFNPRLFTSIQSDS